MAEEVMIRAACFEDATALARLADGLRTDLGDPTGHLTAERIEQDGFGATPEFEVLVAAVGSGDLVGYALYYDVYEPAFASPGVYIADLFVTKLNRRGGLGRRLLRAVADIARARGRSYVWWLASRKNEAALAFYDRLAPEYRSEVVSLALLIRDEPT
jgi:GNAT superfamily N-acetyltransferase